MSMTEITDEKPKAGKKVLNLAGVTEGLREVLERYSDLENERDVERDIARARRVSQNEDGSVNVELLVPVKVNGDTHQHIRLRPLRGRDYFDGTTRDIVRSTEFADTLEMASKLLTKAQAGAIDELDSMDDAMAVWFGVTLVRKNYDRPKT
jgi:hypothetical protein